MNVKIKRLTETAKIPTRGSEYAAGYDLYANEQVEIAGEDTVVIGTGISMEIPEGYFGAIYARSGLATKQGLRPANCVGVIDSDYRGEIKVALRNDNPTIEGYYTIDDNCCEVSRFEPLYSSRKINVGDRIAQLVIQKFEPIIFEEVDELDSTERGSGGFGSTGTN